ncbi:MAG: DegV family EDD domain-containing protein [Oscillospiraceae bacterium]|nr:DegV family EDD domain-containing protein [Oscillospiraceae bacterium]
MKKIVLVAESGADLTPEQTRRYGIEIVPMHVSFGSETRDDGTFPAEEICGYYEKTGVLPKTSGCVPEDFTRVFDRIHAREPEAQILYLAYSAVTTCSFQSAKIAAQGRDYITCIDTKFVSAAQGVIVLRTAQAIEAHPEWDVRMAAAEARALMSRTHMAFIPNDMEYLRAGGRVSNGAALCGKLLNIHPLIEIIDGRLTATQKLRGKLSVLVPKLIPKYAAASALERDELWLIWGPGFPDELKAGAEKAAHSCGFQKITWVKTGGVITAHGGKSAFGIVGFSSK